MRTSSGCWTCRIRRKKCDEMRPVCTVCAALNITCHFDTTKPPWMDGGAKQDEMAKNIKLEIKTRSRRNTAVRQTNHAGDKTTSTSDATASRFGGEPTSGLQDSIAVHSDTVEFAISAADWLPSPESGSVGSRSSTQAESQVSHSPLEPILSTFYLDHVFGFLYPFYQPSTRRGGRAWILELLTGSVAFRQIVMTYSLYFYDLVSPAKSDRNGRTQVENLLQSESSFTTLSQSLQTLLSVGDLGDHTHCACRVLTSIVQHHRYEIATTNSNWKIHLDAALTLFTRLLDNYSNTIHSRHQTSAASAFKNILENLNIPRQEAFVFSVDLMVFDDIVAAASSYQEPRLDQFHQQLLGGENPVLELETIIGVKSCILTLLGQVASLNARKQQDQAAGNLDGMALAQRASTIMEALTANLEQLQTASSLPSTPRAEEQDFLEEFRKPCSSQFSAQHTRLVSQVWAHATIVYLITVVSGWQPANAVLRHHVDQIVQLLQGRIPLPLIRTMVWPLSVAGCLADPLQKQTLLGIVGTLQPIALFPNVHKAARIVKWAWQQGNSYQNDDHLVNNHLDLAACFHSQKNMAKFASGGATHSGKFNGKMIPLMDFDAFPWHADWYKKQVQKTYGEQSDSKIKLHYSENADHYIGSVVSTKGHRLLDFTRLYEQHLRDLSVWRETGTMPQPVVDLTINGGKKAQVKVGARVTFKVHIEVPPGAGKVVSIEWDFEGNGNFVKKSFGRVARTAETTASYTYGKAGTFYPSIRAASYREAKLKTPYALALNLGRDRVVVQ